MLGSCPCTSKPKLWQCQLKDNVPFQFASVQFCSSFKCPSAPLESLLSSPLISSHALPAHFSLLFSLRSSCPLICSSLPAVPLFLCSHQVSLIHWSSSQFCHALLDFMQNLPTEFGVCSYSALLQYVIYVLVETILSNSFLACPDAVQCVLCEVQSARAALCNWNCMQCIARAFLSSSCKQKPWDLHTYVAP